MDAPESGSKPARPRKSAKTAKPTLGPTERKRSLQLKIDYATYERLHLHALRYGTTISGLVMKLATEHLKEYDVHRRGDRSASSERPAAAAE